MDLLRGGIAVLGEKPISNRLDEAREMVALAKQKGIRYGINLNHRFTPAARRAREWLDAGRIGELNFINMKMWINNKKESSEHFHMRALHPHSIDVMRYFGGDVKQVHAFFKKGPGRAIWSNVQVNMLFENGIIGHLLGSYDGGGPGTPWGLETCELVGSQARVVIEDACEKLVFNPRFSWESETYDCLGGMRSFGETFQSRINAWVDDLEAGVHPEKVDGKAEDALKAQVIIEAAIESWATGRVVEIRN
jgi:predicted dehydrogenase